MHRLRLSDGRGQTIEFSADSSILRSRINDAFLAFCQKYRPGGVILEIHHGIHGWQPVYDRQGYCKMIQNPLMIDFCGLTKDISHTLSIVNSWPSRQQRKLSEHQRRSQERETNAQLRRRTFQLIAGGQN